MPIVIPKAIPAFRVLEHENIFVMSKKRAESQDIRPLEIAIVNLMPTKIETETQLMRLLSNTPLQVNVTLVRTESYKSSHTSSDHLEKFYKTFDDILDKKIDGMIITGAPVETLEYDEVLYWEELKKIMDYAHNKVTSSIFICWGAQAALYHYYGINKMTLPQKLFGVFKNSAKSEFEPLLKGLNDRFSIPHSRYTAIDEEAVRACSKLKVIAEGDDCGLSIVKSKDCRKFFFFGHSEYDRDTLKKEYLRDIDKGLDTAPPENYFIDGDTERINMSWNSTGNLLFYNWLNYYVYQVTPYKLEDQ
ncbi:MAG: homoserine O-succinyltransferase [Clostridia bacterium]|nr:homoserine O-succinyltransferase [Clostridia bacterium]